MKKVIESINYSSHNSVICVDLKIVNYLPGQKSDYTTYSCRLSLWDSRVKHQHWDKKEGPFGRANSWREKKDQIFFYHLTIPSRNNFNGREK